MLLLERDDLAHLAQVKSLWDVMGYPKLAGTPEAGPFYYTVHTVNGDGSHSRVERTPNRTRALWLLDTLPPGSFVQMVRTLTHDVVGEQGRASPDTLAVLFALAEAIEANTHDLMRVRRQRRIRGAVKTEHVLVSREAQLKAQFAAIAAGCVLPPETVAQQG